MFRKVSVWQTRAKLVSVLWELLKEVTVSSVKVTSLRKALGHQLSTGICGKLLHLQKIELEKQSQERLECPMVHYGISSCIPYDQLKDWLKVTSFVKVNCCSNPEYLIPFTWPDLSAVFLSVSTFLLFTVLLCVRKTRTLWKSAL